MLSRSVGPVTVIALPDAEGLFFQPRTEAFPTATAAHWRLADERDPDAVTADGQWRLQFRCFALRIDDGPAAGRVILVDAGIGPADSPARSWAPVPGRLPAELAAAGIAPEQVDTVVLTHLHTDHVGWAVTGDPGTPYFGNARYLLQRAEVDAFRRHDRSGVTSHLIDPLTTAGRLDPLDGDVRLAPGVRIVATPGHTPGHQSVLIEHADQSVLLTGDLLVHAVQLVAPELPYLHEDDPVTARASRERLLTELATRPAATLGTPHLTAPFTPL